MKRVEQMIPAAITAIKECKIAEQGKVDKEFNGYISSMGASIISAGLLPTLVFFSHKGGSEKNRPAIIKGIEYILHQHKYLQPSEQLLNKVLQLTNANNNSELRIVARYITDAAVALKLAIRTYPKNEK